MAVILLAVVFRRVFAPLGLALALAYILNPIMRWGQRHRVPRGLMAVLMFLGVIGVAVGLLLFAVPPLAEELYGFGVAVVGEPTEDSAAGYVDLNGNGRRDEGYLAELLVWARGLGKHSTAARMPGMTGFCGRFRSRPAPRKGSCRGRWTSSSRRGWPSARSCGGCRGSSSRRLWRRCTCSSSSWVSTGWSRRSGRGCPALPPAD